MLKNMADDLRYREAAQRYAAADKSDPFALKRALTHLRNGVASVFNQKKEAYYNADEATESRFLPDGKEYQTTVYRNRYRP